MYLKRSYFRVFPGMEVVSIVVSIYDKCQIIQGDELLRAAKGMEQTIERITLYCSEHFAQLNLWLEAEKEAFRKEPH